MWHAPLIGHSYSRSKRSVGAPARSGGGCMIHCHGQWIRSNRNMKEASEYDGLYCISYNNKYNKVFLF